jgi:hypothetical protein
MLISKINYWGMMSSNEIKKCRKNYVYTGEPVIISQEIKKGRGYPK